MDLSLSFVVLSVVLMSVIGFTQTKRFQGFWMKFLKWTDPVDQELAIYLKKRWDSLPEHVKTDAQILGKAGRGCEGTHGVFPACNFSCKPCYHSKDANAVRVDGDHTVKEIEKQMKFLESSRGRGIHAQLIGGEVALLKPEDHAKALQVMRDHGRMPMSMSNGDFDYEYLRDVAVDPETKIRRWEKISFAAHFDCMMFGRRGISRPKEEADLDPYRKKFVDMFKKLKREHNIKYFIAHNMTIQPKNVEQIPSVLRANLQDGWNMFSFQPAAYVGDDARWLKGGSGYRDLTTDYVWSKIEEGVGARIPYKLFQFGDRRCNRTAWGYFVGKTYFPLVDDQDLRDHEVRNQYLQKLGALDTSGEVPRAQVISKLARAFLTDWNLTFVIVYWILRSLWKILKVEGLVSLMRNGVQPTTFVIHNFMDERDVQEAWDLMEKGIVAENPKILETQERLQACSYAMGHPENGRVVPACVQHSILDKDENKKLAELLPCALGSTSGTTAGSEGKKILEW